MNNTKNNLFYTNLLDGEFELVCGNRMALFSVTIGVISKTFLSRLSEKFPSLDKRQLFNESSRVIF